MDRRYIYFVCISIIIFWIYNIILCGNVFIFLFGILDKKCIWFIGIVLLYYFLLIIINNIIDIIYVLNNISNIYINVVSINVIFICFYILFENYFWVIVYGKKFWFNDYLIKFFFFIVGGFF